MPEFYTDVELKFAKADEPKGIFEGYAAFFGNLDSHKDIIKAGAFKESLEERKAAGRSIPMHVMHKYYGGDGLPVGVYQKVEEDDKGLRVTGKISGMNTDTGKLMYERAKDGAFGGLSIGYKIKDDGFTPGKKGEAHKRLLTNLDLREISLVDSPSNAMTRADSFKSDVISEFKELMKLTDVNKATAAVAGAIILHSKTLQGKDSPTVDERSQMLQHLCDAHEALCGQRMPPGMKATPETIRDFETFLRDECKFSNAQARAIAEHGFKALSDHRDDDDDAAKQAEKSARELLKGLAPSS